MTRHARGILGIAHIGQYDDELIPAEPGDQILGAEGRAQPLRDGPEQLIPDGMAVLVIDRLEVVQIEEQDRQLGAGAVGARQHVPGELVEQGACRQTGQRVVLSQPDGVIFAFLASGDILIDQQHVLQDTVGVADRDEAGQEPVIAPIPTPQPILDLTVVDWMVREFSQSREDAYTILDVQPIRPVDEAGWSDVRITVGRPVPVGRKQDMIRAWLPLPAAHFGDLGHQAQPFLAVAQGLLGALARRDVDQDDAAGTRRRGVRFGRQTNLQVHPARRSRLLAPQAQLIGLGLARGSDLTLSLVMGVLVLGVDEVGQSLTGQ